MKNKSSYTVWYTDEPEAVTFTLYLIRSVIYTDYCTCAHHQEFLLTKTIKHV